MPKAFVNGVNLYYEVTGQGFPLILGHEFCADFAAWDPQVRFLQRRYQVITYNARGWPPSDVPDNPSDYSWEHGVEDLYQLLRHLDIKQAYIGGLSLGGYVSLAFGLAHPEMAKGLIMAATGAGAFFDAAKRKEWEHLYEGNANRIEAEGMQKMKDEYAHEDKRIQLRHKDPKGWKRYYDALGRHSPVGSANTIRRFIIPRPTIFALETELGQIEKPALILTGDEDDPCVEPSLFMKRHIAHSGLVVFPQSGHTINVEEPELFNWALLDFLTSVDAESWK
jgi:pimeloyl-ACP methyl ester carboxylesterase